MRRIALLTLGVAALVAAGCGGPSGPGGAQMVSAPAAGPEEITVREFTTEGATIAWSEYQTFGLAMAEEVAGELRRRGHRAEAVPAGATPRTPIVVSGRLTVIDGGSRAQRYWVGFGAGAAKVGAAGAVTRADGKEIARFANERWSGFGVFGGSSKALLQKCLRKVGREIGEMVHSGKYRQ